jgi:hypothetical protein
LLIGDIEKREKEEILQLDLKTSSDRKVDFNRLLCFKVNLNRLLKRWKSKPGEDDP